MYIGLHYVYLVSDNVTMQYSNRNLFTLIILTCLIKNESKLVLFGRELLRYSDHLFCFMSLVTLANSSLECFIIGTFEDDCHFSVNVLE